MKMQFEVTSISGAKRAQEILAAYIHSANLPAAAAVVRERLTAPAPSNGWIPAKRAAQSAKLKAAWKRKKKARA